MCNIVKTLNTNLIQMLALRIINSDVVTVVPR
jgi:hypothetical protein